MSRLLWLPLCLMALCSYAQNNKLQHSHMEDSVALRNVTVFGKSKTQRLREGALSVNAIDINSFIGSIHSLNS